MHDAANAVTDVLLDHAVARVLGMFLHHGRDFRPPAPPRQFVDRELQYLPCHLDQAPALRPNLADHDSDSCVGTPAVQLASRVNLDQIAFLDLPMAGDAVNDLLVDGNAS